MRSGHLGKTKSQINSLDSEIADINKAKEQVTNAEFGVALLAKMVLKLRKSGFAEEAATLRAQLDAVFDVQGAVRKTLKTGIVDVFALDVLKQVHKSPAAPAAKI